MKRYTAHQAWKDWYKYRLAKRSGRGEIFLKRRDFFYKFLSSIKDPPHLRILDIGCGEGDTIHEIESFDYADSNSYEFYGMDITKNVLTSAKKESRGKLYLC